MVAATSPGAIKNYFFTYCDKKSGITFLVDTGTTVSVFPVSQAEVSSRRENSGLLIAANGTPIAFFGHCDITLTVVLRWPFLLARVTRTILGADFLCHSGLLVDTQNRRLVKADSWDVAPSRAYNCGK